jgi:superfamily II DNA or RNA helicase
MVQLTQAPAPGARALIRDEEWIVQNADMCDMGGWQLSCIGVSETVRNRRALFLSVLDEVMLIDPAATTLVHDDSPTFLAARLYIEARLRQAALQNDAIVLGHRAVMDALPFQLVPAHQVLQQLRPRLLIADTVGLGKTLEGGIVAAELMRRGRARRILVVTTKSMMRQFQQELWNRFTIALTRLDSAGIQRIRREIPANHNPFHYYDRTIISVDTLKRDSEYRHYLENAWWDLIIIDEAHNVSYKGNRTQSNRLASLLAKRSDALVLLTATPHNGRKESFASLMRMLDPTVLPQSDRAEYTREDVANLFVRRFKKDVREQMRQDFPEREVFRLARDASTAENAAFEALAAMKLSSDAGQQRDGAMLFRTVLEKALFSSPAACLQTIRERTKRLETRDPSHPDLPALRDLQRCVGAITLAQFSKFQHLIEQLRSGTHWRWTGQDASDRLVLFTERIETLKFLRDELPAALGLRDNAVGILHGQLSDIEIQETVENFGKTNSPLRLLIASDVASEGLNLHFQSHRLIHFDIPWSLMVFQQRNGRVDRYGQLHVPKIAYMLTMPGVERIRGDLRYLEILIDKDEQAARNIGDPSSFMGLYDEEQEAAKVAEAIEKRITAEAFAAQLAQGDVDPFEALWSASQAAATTSVEPTASAAPEAIVTAPTEHLTTLFADDYRYVRDALTWLRQQSPREYQPVQSHDDKHTLSFQPSADLALLLKRELAAEMWPEDNQFSLSADLRVVEASIRHARDTNAWPQVQYLWPLHPVAQWLDFKLMALFGRQKAPVIRIPVGMSPGEAIVLVLAQVPNRRGQTMVSEWMGVHLDARAQVRGVMDLEAVISLTGITGSDLANDGRPIDVSAIQAALPAVIQTAERHLKPIKQAFDAKCRQRKSEELCKLKTLEARHFEQLKLDFAGGIEQVNAARRKQRETDTEELFKEYQDWVRDTLELDDRAQYTVVAVLAGCEA